MVEEQNETKINPTTEEEPQEAPHTEEEQTTAQAEDAQTEEDLQGLEDDEQESAQSFSDPEIAKLLERSFANVEEGRIVKGRIVQIHDSDALVDIGYKSEGTIPLREFKTQSGEPLEVHVGDEVDVFLEDTEDENGLVVLSKEKADRIQIWEDITKAYEEGREVHGKVCERIKGGLSVDIGVKAFLPGSQVDLRPIRNLETMIGETIRTKIIKLNRRRGNIVLSRRVILEEERESARQETLEKLEEGKIIGGIVKNITDYGVFIDLGGIDGLLHITDISWGRVNHPSELFQIGDEIDVVILQYDVEEEKVSLGLKQKTPDPWESAAEKYPVGSRVTGKVVSITDYGAFVELETGIEGLVHISEMSWTKRVKHPSKVVSLHDTIEAIVLDLDTENRRISLGLKQIEPNPWVVVAEKYPPGSIVTGIVRNLTDFGAFVELEEGIDGLVHISDMSWTTRVKHPSEVLKKGEQVQAVLLNIDIENERLSLGIKQLLPNPWEGISNEIAVGENVTGKVVRLTDFGAFVELENGVEGLLHVSEISHQHVKKPEDVLSTDQMITAKVIKLDEENRRIGLSIKAYEEEMRNAETPENEERPDTAQAEEPERQEVSADAEAPEAEASEDTQPVEESSEAEPEATAETEETPPAAPPASDAAPADEPEPQSEEAAAPPEEPKEDA
ncbi:30S ribosomal protein S1 [candidate division KSB3 bacterium]|uniref:Small ribosomal subunit protein bS1 n=1 Tax=candidate division KSB3 bacterium TaxID=2044937 RepID=A0A9D5JSI4_9BACT|nr:30S ribosomal protein S1 [candidate division KSB3 bacterium]MBD3323181.1 30S ribosomal protein S1 [candidate division KSB3 bacterium]